MLRTNNEVVVQSLGGAETVTGSKHLLRTPEMAVLIDCGLFQGLKQLRQRNWDKLPVPPAEIEALILTHAHLDHCGYIPLLVKNGFKGKIYMTPPTKDLAKLILLDSAKIQEEDAEKANTGKYSKHNPALPLYTVDDAEWAIKNFVTIDHNINIQLSPHISFQFIKNGHILGSCFVDMECYGRKILFSGDIGRFHQGFLAPPTYIKEADILFMESTYGDRLHDNHDPGHQLAEAILETYRHHGNVLIPAFAVGRAQELIRILTDLKKSNAIPVTLPVYLDSPMAADATDILCRYSDWHCLSQKECTLMCQDVTINREFDGTHAIIADKKPKVVIAASGMLTGGRVLEYMKHYAPERKNTILLAGYQAEGTRGRALLEGKKEVKIHGRFIPVNARVAEISGLSAHADQGEMLQWINGFDKKPGSIFLIHGELNAMNVFKEKIISDLKIETSIMPAAESVLLYKVQ
jgi:metallo-beta-lactamase family protein